MRTATTKALTGADRRRISAKLTRIERRVESLRDVPDDQMDARELARLEIRLAAIVEELPSAIAGAETPLERLQRISAELRAERTPREKHLRLIHGGQSDA